MSNERKYNYRSFLEPDNEDVTETVLSTLRVYPEGLVSDQDKPPFLDGELEIACGGEPTHIPFFSGHEKDYKETVETIEIYKTKLEILRRAIDTAQDAVEDYEREVELYYGE